MLEQEMIYSEDRGTWNLIVNGEWFMEGDYETIMNAMITNADDVMDGDYYDYGL